MAICKSRFTTTKQRLFRGVVFFASLEAVGLGLLALSLVWPTYVLPWMAWEKEVLAFAGAWLVIAASVSSKRERFYFSLPKPTAWLGGLLVALIGHALVKDSAYQGVAITTAMYLGVATLLVGAGYSQYPRKETLPALAAMFVFASVSSVLMAWTQCMGVWNDITWIIAMPSTRRPGGNLGQPNHLATLALFGLSSLIYLYRRKKVSASFALSLAALLASGLGIAESRTGLFGAIGMVCWWWWKGALSPRERTYSLLLLLATLLFYARWPGLYTDYWIYLSGKTPEVNTEVGGRLTVWPQLMEAANLKPWFGWGLNNVVEAHNAVADRYPQSEAFSYAHNVELDLILGLGWPIGLAFIAMALVWLVVALRRCSAGDNDAWYLLTPPLLLLWHSQLEFPHTYAYFLFPVAYMVGAYAAHTNESALTIRSPTSLRWLVAAMTVISVASVAEYLTILEDFQVVRFETMRIGRRPDDHRPPQVYIYKNLGVMLEAARITPSPQLTKEELETLKGAAKRFPWTALENRYALGLICTGSVDEGIRQLKVMRAIHGERHYKKIKDYWQNEATRKCPVINSLELP